MTERDDERLLADPIFADKPQEEDVYLLCSDGLHNLLDGSDLLELMLVEDAPAAIVDRLIKAANRRLLQVVCQRATCVRIRRKPS